MKQIFIITFLIVAINCNAKAQTWQKTNTGIKTSINNVDVEIQFYTASTVRIIKSPAGTSFIKKSLSVIALPEKINFSTKQKSDVLILKTEKLSVQYSFRSGEIRFLDKAG